jgi:primosomal protein N''
MVLPGLGVGRAQEKQTDEQREMVAVLAALSLLNNTKLLKGANAYLVGKLKARLQGFNRTTNTWNVKQEKTERTEAKS